MYKKFVLIITFIFLFCMESFALSFDDKLNISFKANYNIGDSVEKYNYSISTDTQNLILDGKVVIGGDYEIIKHNDDIVHDIEKQYNFNTLFASPTKKYSTSNNNKFYNIFATIQAVKYNEHSVYFKLNYHDSLKYEDLLEFTLYHKLFKTTSVGVLYNYNGTFNTSFTYNFIDCDVKDSFDFNISNIIFDNDYIRLTLGYELYKEIKQGDKYWIDYNTMHFPLSYSNQKIDDLIDTQHKVFVTLDTKFSDFVNSYINLYYQDSKQFGKSLGFGVGVEW